MWGSDVTFHSVTKYINGKMYFCFFLLFQWVNSHMQSSMLFNLSFQVDSVYFSIANRAKTFNC